MASGVNVPLSNLRAVVILIVVGFHAALPYLASQPSVPFAFDVAPYRWIAFPILDHERWFGFDLFCAWQDVSLMTLMFFLAGVFTPLSLARRGSLAYIRERGLRIGLPFILVVALLSPLAYYASWRLTAGDPSFETFWRHWRALPMWPSGPEWFLWQLLLLSALAAALHALAPRWTDRAGRRAGRVGERPLAFFAALAALSAAGYVPLAMIFSPWDWTYFGPLSFQLSRPLHYVVYFFAAFALGSYGSERGLLRTDGPLARHALAWAIAALACFMLWGGFTSRTLPDWNASPLIWRIASAVAFPLACATGVFAYLAAALRLLRRADRVLDSLSANAYGVYLVHYVFVLWLQYALTGVRLNAVGKFALVLIAALAMSWACSAGLRNAAKLLRHPFALRRHSVTADHAR